MSEEATDRTQLLVEHAALEAARYALQLRGWRVLSSVFRLGLVGPAGVGGRQQIEVTGKFQLVDGFGHQEEAIAQIVLKSAEAASATQGQLTDPEVVRITLGGERPESFLIHFGTCGWHAGSGLSLRAFNDHLEAVAREVLTRLNVTQCTRRLLKGVPLHLAVESCPTVQSNARRSFAVGFKVHDMYGRGTVTVWIQLSDATAVAFDRFKATAVDFSLDGQLMPIPL